MLWVETTDDTNDPGAYHRLRKWVIELVREKNFLQATRRSLSDVDFQCTRQLSKAGKQIAFVLYITYTLQLVGWFITDRGCTKLHKFNPVLQTTVQGLSYN